MVDSPREELPLAMTIPEAHRGRLEELLRELLRDERVRRLFCNEEVRGSEPQIERKPFRLKISLRLVTPVIGKAKAPTTGSEVPGMSKSGCGVGPPLPPPPAEQVNAREDQAGKARTGNRAGHPCGLARHVIDRQRTRV